MMRGSLAFQRMRRRLLLAAVAGLAAPGALAAPPDHLRLQPPFRLAYARLSPEGLARPARIEQDAFNALRVRTGELISDLEPLPLGGLFNLSPPESDGGAACILLARQLAQAAGHNLVLLYATDDGQRTYPHKDKWLSRAFASLRSAYGPYDPADGEAHLFDTAGGPPLLSVTADARPKIALNVFDRREPESEAFDRLVRDFELRLQGFADAWLASERSIADGLR